MSWTPVEAALVTAITHYAVEADFRPSSGPGSSTADLMTTLLDEIQGLCSGAIDPHVFMLMKEEAPR